MPNIAINHLTVSYKNKKNKTKIFAIDDLTTAFHDGKINVLIGESGSGKTTLLKSICALLKYNGQILFDDTDIKNTSYSKLNLSYINQEFGLYPHMTIFENVAFPLMNKKIKKEIIFKEVDEILDLFEIKLCQNRLPKDLSIGQQQRVAIARSLIKNPSILLMDEPFSNLDDNIKEKIKKIIFKYAKDKHITVIYVTHNIHEAILSADYLYVMENGKIVLSGTKEEVMKSDNELIKLLIKETF